MPAGDGREIRAYNDRAVGRPNWFGLAAGCVVELNLNMSGLSESRRVRRGARAGVWNIKLCTAKRLWKYHLTIALSYNDCCYTQNNCCCFCARTPRCGVVSHAHALSRECRKRADNKISVTYFFFIIKTTTRAAVAVSVRARVHRSQHAAVDANRGGGGHFARS